jgi:transposase
MADHAVLGIDVSQKTLVCALLDVRTRKPRWEKPFPNTEAGIRKLLAQTPADVPWVMEPTGNYSLFVAKQAQQAGRTVCMADPKAAHHYLKSRQGRAKTDKIDAVGLAQMFLDRELKPYPIKPVAMEQADQLLAARRGISDAMARLKQQARELPHAAGPLQQAIQGLQEQQQELERQISALTQKEAALAVAVELDRVPGIGLITATAAVSRLASRTFARADQFVAYIGYDIRIRQSGQKKGELGLSRHGDAELRRLFYLCAKSSVRTKESPFAAQYEREKKKGLKPTAALCVIARKMARLAWSLHHYGTRYDPARVYESVGQPA